MKPVKKKIVEKSGFQIVTRKIGDKSVSVQYEDGAKGYAMQALDKEEAEYLEAVETSQRSVEELMYELLRTHDTKEKLKQNTCAKCGHHTLKERRGRMRVFGGLFYTDSKPAPYKHCTNCGHDQEYNTYHPPHEDSARRVAEIMIERANKRRAKYETKPPKTLLEEERL